MKIEFLLSSLEEYFDLRHEVGGGDLPHLQEAKQRAGMALNEYINKQFDHLMIHERRLSSSDTRKVEIVNPDNATVSWASVAELLDALNGVPTPMRDVSNPLMCQKWMNSYKTWFDKKRKDAINSVAVSNKLDLDLDEDL